MKKYLLFLFLSPFYFLQAQIDNALSPNLKLGKEMGYTLLGINHDEYYINEYHIPTAVEKQDAYKKSNLMRYDFQNKLVSQTEIDAQYEGNQMRLTSIFNVRNNSYALWQGFDLQKNEQNIFFQKFDASGGLTGGYIKICSNYCNGKFFSPMFRWHGQARRNPKRELGGVFISPDSSKIAYITSSKNAPSGKDKTTHILICVMNADLSKVWEKEIELPYADHVFAIANAMVSNSGKILLGCKYSGASKIKLDFAFKLFTVDNGIAKEVAYTMPDKMEIVTVEFVPEINDNVSVCGFYTRQNKFAPPVMNGTCVFHVNLSNATIDKIVADENPKELSANLDLRLSDCLHLADGGLMMVGAQNLFCNDGNENLTDSYDKFVILYDKNLSRKAVYVIPGRNVGDRFMSIRAIPMGEKIVVFYQNSGKEQQEAGVFTNIMNSNSDTKLGKTNYNNLSETEVLYFQGGEVRKIDENKILVSSRNRNFMKVGVVSPKRGAN